MTNAKLYEWIKHYWRQDGQRTKWVCHWRGYCWGLGEIQETNQAQGATDDAH